MQKNLRIDIIIMITFTNFIQEASSIQVEVFWADSFELFAIATIASVNHHVLHLHNRSLLFGADSSAEVWNRRQRDPA
jgi:hypothetical protein